MIGAAAFLAAQVHWRERGDYHYQSCPKAPSEGCGRSVTVVSP
jgi:hypothetical protein